VSYADGDGETATLDDMDGDAIADTYVVEDLDNIVAGLGLVVPSGATKAVKATAVAERVEIITTTITNEGGGAGE